MPELSERFAVFREAVDRCPIIPVSTIERLAPDSLAAPKAKP